MKKLIILLIMIFLVVYRSFSQFEIELDSVLVNSGINLKLNFINHTRSEFIIPLSHWLIYDESYKNAYIHFENLYFFNSIKISKNSELILDIADATFKPVTDKLPFVLSIEPDSTITLYVRISEYNTNFFNKDSIFTFEIELAYTENDYFREYMSKYANDKNNSRHIYFIFNNNIDLKLKKQPYFYSKKSEIKLNQIENYYLRMLFVKKVKTTKTIKITK